MSTRVWLANYDPGVPATLAPYPDDDLCVRKSCRAPSSCLGPSDTPSNHAGLPPQARRDHARLCRAGSPMFSTKRTGRCCHGQRPKLPQREIWLPIDRRRKKGAFGCQLYDSLPTRIGRRHVREDNTSRICGHPPARLPPPGATMA